VRESREREKDENSVWFPYDDAWTRKRQRYAVSGEKSGVLAAGWVGRIFGE